MKTWRRAILVSLIVMLLAAVVPTAQAGNEATLTIVNLTQSTVVLKLSGPTDETVTIATPYSKVTLEYGKYEYSYRACGLRRTGKFTIGYGGRTLKLLKCEKGANATLVILNLTGRVFSLLLNGPNKYLINILPGDYKYTVQAGRYEYKAFVCGETRTGEHPMKSKNNPDWVWRCK